MQIGEMQECLKVVASHYAFKLNEHVVHFWHKKIGQYYTKQEFLDAFELYLEHGERAPFIPQMKSCLRVLHGVKSPSNPVKVSAPLRKIDICMDVLGAQHVAHEIKSIIGAPKGSGDWSRLVSRKDWVPAYNKKLEDLYAKACERVIADRGHLPSEWPKPAKLSVTSGSLNFIREKGSGEGSRVDLDW